MGIDRLYYTYYPIGMPKNEIYLPTIEIAKLFSVSQKTVGDWIRNGDIKAKKKNPLRRNSPYLVPKSEVERLLKLQEQGEG